MKIDISSRKFPDAVCVIDDEDFSKTLGYSWHVLEKINKSGRVYRYAAAWKNKKITLLHRLILSAPQGMLVDHRNGDGLDCRKQNIRICTRGQNNSNRVKKDRASSKFLGVGWDNGWRVQLTKDRKHYRSRRFTDEIDAAREYNRMALFHHGEFARLNEV